MSTTVSASCTLCAWVTTAKDANTLQRAHAHHYSAAHPAFVEEQLRLMGVIRS